MLNQVGQEIKREFENNEEVCRHVIGLFQMIAHKTRFRIVCILSRGEFCVAEIADILGTDKLSNLSQQLKILRLSGIIENRRDEKRMIYSLKDDRVREVIAFFKEKYL